MIPALIGFAVGSYVATEITFWQIERKFNIDLDKVNELIDKILEEKIDVDVDIKVKGSRETKDKWWEFWK